MDNYDIILLYHALGEMLFMKIGYARVSKKDQNLDLQIDALTKAGCEKIYQDKISSC